MFIYYIRRGNWAQRWPEGYLNSTAPTVPIHKTPCWSSLGYFPLVSDHEHVVLTHLSSPHVPHGDTLIGSLAWAPQGCPIIHVSLSPASSAGASK